MALRAVLTKYARAQGGASAVEFAIIAPMLVVMLIGIICYGGYFWMAHAVQQVANDAARAAMAGATDAERATLAQGVVASEISAYAYLNPASAALTMTDENQTVTVTIAYNAATSPFWAMATLIPMPAQTIQRSVAIQLGGY